MKVKTKFLSIAFSILALFAISISVYSENAKAAWYDVDDSGAYFAFGGTGWVLGDYWYNSYGHSHSYAMAGDGKWANWYFPLSGTYTFQNAQIYLNHPNFKASASYYFIKNETAHLLGYNISQEYMPGGFSYVGANWAIEVNGNLRVHAKTWYGGNAGKLFGADAVSFGYY